MKQLIDLQAALADAAPEFRWTVNLRPPSGEMYKTTVLVYALTTIAGTEYEWGEYYLPDTVPEAGTIIDLARAAKGRVEAALST